MPRHAAESFDAFDSVFYPETALPRRRGLETYTCSCNMELHDAMSDSDLFAHRVRYHAACGQCKCEPCACGTTGYDGKTLIDGVVATPYFEYSDLVGGGIVEDEENDVGKMTGAFTDEHGNPVELVRRPDPSAPRRQLRTTARLERKSRH